MSEPRPPKITVEITDATEFHCFKVTLYAHDEDGDTVPIVVMLHASDLVDLIHKSSLALCEWQRQTTEDLLAKITGLTADELRARGLIS